jgi:glyoxylase-like metal-dependent hydrolase (beta-lactamase superfamily II)
VSAVTFSVGKEQLTRAGYADVEVPPAVVGLTHEQVAAATWAEPTWARDGQVRVGAAAWVIESGEARIVVDPALAADEILRTDADAASHQQAFAAALDRAGLPRDTITHAVATHLDGIGMFAWRNDDGTWSPFFENAPILFTQTELDAIDDSPHPPSGTTVLNQLRARGAVHAVADTRTRLTDDVTLELTGGHSPGHQVVRISSDGESAVILGHLALSPIHLEVGECPGQHVDSATAFATLESLRDDGALLIGPLWPAPGAGRWNGERLVDVSSPSTRQ